MPSYASILSAALLLSTSATRAAPLATNNAGLSYSDDAVVVFLLGLPVHNPCATHRELKERNQGCETETFLYFEALFGGWCPDGGELRHDDDAPSDILLNLFGRAPRAHRRRESRHLSDGSHHAEIRRFEYRH